MKLDQNALLSLARGFSYAEQDAEGYLHFHRFTKKGEVFYREILRGDRDLEALGTAGVCLRFTTDAAALSFDYLAATYSDCPFALFDITVDGAPALCPPPPAAGEDGGTARLTLDGKTHTVSVCFSALRALCVKDLTLDGATFCAPVKRARKLYCLGDSITHGYHARDPMNTYPNLLADKLDAEVLNHGVAAEVFRPDMLDPDLPFAPDIITVAYGTNDWNSRGHDGLVADANEFYARLRAYFPNAKIFAVTPLWRGDCDRVTKVGPFAEVGRIIRAAAEAQKGVVVLDGTTLVPHDPAYFSPDKLHPNDAGFRVYAEALARVITPYLNENGK